MKTKNQEMIQQFMDEGDYPNLFPIILKSKLTPLEKLAVSTMTNNIRMNGSVTWKHQTYADKLGSSRNVMINMFHKLIELGILIPNESNKAGGKGNTFTISFSSIEDYKPVPRKKPVTSSSKPVTSSPNKPVTSSSKPVTSSSKPVTSNPKPVTSSSKPVTSSSKPVTSNPKPVTSSSKPVTSSIHINKLKETNKENNKESKEEDFDNGSFFGNSKIRNSNQEYLDSRKKELVFQQDDINDFLNNLDI